MWFPVLEYRDNAYYIRFFKLGLFEDLWPSTIPIYMYKEQAQKQCINHTFFIKQCFLVQQYVLISPFHLPNFHCYKNSVYFRHVICSLHNVGQGLPIGNCQTLHQCTASDETKMCTFIQKCMQNEESIQYFGVANRKKLLPLELFSVIFISKLLSIL